MNALAAKFSELLIAELGEATVKHIVAESRKEGHNTVNDYTDGNQVYIDAAEALGIDVFDESGPKVDLYNDTWQEALACMFGLPATYTIEIIADAMAAQWG